MFVSDMRLVIAAGTVDSELFTRTMRHQKTLARGNHWRSNIPRREVRENIFAGISVSPFWFTEIETRPVISDISAGRVARPLYVKFTSGRFWTLQESCKQMGKLSGPVHSPAERRPAACLAVVCPGFSECGGRFAVGGNRSFSYERSDLFQKLQWSGGGVDSEQQHDKTKKFRDLHRGKNRKEKSSK